MGFFAWLKSLRKPKPKKLGLALGSGGAKGFAHLGAIKAFEENGIEFDIIGGTSIGSIVGAFYADGYTSTDIFEMLKKVDIGEIANLFMIGMDTSGLMKVIDRTIGEKNIEELKKPFVAVATEIESGLARPFKTGSTALALSASASIPPFFKPVVIGGDRFVDGAFSDSIPADYVKEMGADYIVGIDLSTPEGKPTILSKLFPTYEKKVDDPKKAGYDNSNVMIHPDLTGYNSTSFKKAYEMYEIGYRATLEVVDKIKSDINNLKSRKK